MAYEIDYLTVGDGCKSGDAIALRFGNIPGSREEQTIVIIDGGFKESGARLVEHVKTHYGTDRVDLVISTHPDTDHASGLSVVLEELEVGKLAMHLPWEHASEIQELFDPEDRITTTGLKQKLKNSLEHAKNLEKLAKDKGVEIVEPFQGITGYNGTIHILGPSQEYYQSLLPAFRCTPGPAASGILAPIFQAVEAAKNYLQDLWHIDLLDDDEDTTSAENNTSTVILFTIDGNKLLFTGDAGKTALSNAADYSESLGVPLTDLSFFDVPHHGSKRNLNSKLLKRICGTVAYISASSASEKHPSKRVTNALQKHGATVFVTRENGILHRCGAPERPGWFTQATIEPFHDYVEE